VLNIFSHSPVERSRVLLPCTDFFFYRYLIFFSISNHSACVRSSLARRIVLNCFRPSDTRYVSFSFLSGDKNSVSIIQYTIQCIASSALRVVFYRPRAPAGVCRTREMRRRHPSSAVVVRTGVTRFVWNVDDDGLQQQEAAGGLVIRHGRSDRIVAGAGGCWHVAPPRVRQPPQDAHCS